MSVRHAAAAAALLALTACTSGAATPPPASPVASSAGQESATAPAADAEATAWAQQVCGGLVEGISALERLPDGDSRKPAAYRDAIGGYLTELGKSFDGMRATLEGAGPPPVDGGEQLLKQGTAQLDTAKAVVGLAQKKLAATDTSSQAAFQAGFAGVADELRKLVSAGNVVNVLRANPDVDGAFAAAPDCAPLGETSAIPTSVNVPA